MIWFSLMLDSGCCLYSTFMVLHLEGNSFFWGAGLESFCPWISTFFLFLFFFLCTAPSPFCFNWAAVHGRSCKHTVTTAPHFFRTPHFACCYLEEISSQCSWLFLLLKKPWRDLSFKLSLFVSLHSFYSPEAQGLISTTGTSKLPRVFTTPPEMLGGLTSG